MIAIPKEWEIHPPHDNGCKNCDGCGWVCENHIGRPWEGLSIREDACDCGAGAPCPICCWDMATAGIKSVAFDIGWSAAVLTASRCVHQSFDARQSIDDVEEDILALAPQRAGLACKVEWQDATLKKPDGLTFVLVQGGIAFYDKSSDEWRSVTGIEYPGRKIQWPVRKWAYIPDPDNAP